MADSSQTPASSSIPIPAKSDEDRYVNMPESPNYVTLAGETRPVNGGGGGDHLNPAGLGYLWYV